MSNEEDCLSRAYGRGTDPSGVPWAELEPGLLYDTRSSIKWARFSSEVLPMFVAEMDFTVAPEVRAAIVRAVEASDIGYVENSAPLAEAFASFAEDRWAWEVPHRQVHLATDVATGIVESLRLSPKGQNGRLVLPTPCYPGFFEMLEEVAFDVVEVPLLAPELPDGPGAPARLDLTAIEREFETGANAFLLCNPHNPHGVPFSREELAELAQLAARYDVFVVSDEIHAPLTHSGAAFVPFAPLAAEAGALAVIVTSASKGWNLAGAKCSVVVAADERANLLLDRLPPEVITRTSILGLHANVAAFGEGREWLDRTVAQIEANQALFASLASRRLPGIRYAPGTAGYLAWLDLRDAGLGERPVQRLRTEGRIALNDGRHFGRTGPGFARLNLACAPDTLVQGVDRIASLLQTGARV